MGFSYLIEPYGILWQHAITTHPNLTFVTAGARARDVELKHIQLNKQFQILIDDSREKNSPYMRKQRSLEGRQNEQQANFVFLIRPNL